LDEFVVMPNHVHGIVVIVDTPPNKIMTPSNVGKRHAVSGSLSTIVRSHNSAVARLVNRIRETPGAKIWQGRYHDHIIRTEQGLNTLREYILHNPARWAEDQFNIPTT